MKAIVTTIKQGTRFYLTPLQIEDKKQGKECICNDGFGMNLSCLAHDSTQQGKIERDYEPEQAYGTAHDIQEHIRYGGTREDY